MNFWWFKNKNTVKPLNSGHFGNSKFACFSEVKGYKYIGVGVWKMFSKYKCSLYGSVRNGGFTIFIVLHIKAKNC